MQFILHSSATRTVYSGVNWRNRKLYKPGKQNPPDALAWGLLQICFKQQYKNKHRQKLVHAQYGRHRWCLVDTSLSFHWLVECLEVIKPPYRQEWRLSIIEGQRKQ